MKQALIVGASRGIGLGLAREFLRRGWGVGATVRAGSNAAGIEALRAAFGDGLWTAQVDTRSGEDIARLAETLSQRRLDLDVLVINAGVGGDVSAMNEPLEEGRFIEVMMTNAFAPVRVADALFDHVAADGLIGFMSSITGSVSLNTGGRWEAYRASKSALNSLIRSFAARRSAAGRTILAIHPGYVRTDMGGPNATIGLDESVPGVVDLIEREAGTGGHRFLDWKGEVVPW
jgi:NAD(P)-dependent dehydrogenase (short-subunit alcohol dehydrogenase family)